MKNLLLLHGALGSAEQLEPLAERLSNDYRVYLLNFSGHGGKELTDESFSIEKFSNEIVKFIEKGRLRKTDVFGYSMGGYAALHAARHNTGKLNRIFTVATKFDWNEETSLKESRLLNPEKILEKVPAFASQLIERHSEKTWKQVLQKTSQMMINLGLNPSLKGEDFSLIENEIRLGVGDKDNMVSIEETANIFRKLRNGSMIVFPDTQHSLEKFSTERLTSEIKIFFG